MVIVPMTMIPHLMVIGIIIVEDAIIVGVGIRPILVLQPQIKMSWLSPIQDLVDADVIIHTIWMVVGVIMVIARSIILRCNPTGHWQNGGEHCCNSQGYTVYTNEVCKGCQGECGDICVPDSSIKVVSAGEFCSSSLNQANEQAFNKYKEYKNALQFSVDARVCPSKVGNDDRWGNVKATNCPNCTPKTISYKQIAGKYEACTKDEANRIADNNLQSDGISYANGLAQADRCNCVEPTKDVVMVGIYE